MTEGPPLQAHPVQQDAASLSQHLMACTRGWCKGVMRLGPHTCPPLAELLADHLMARHERGVQRGRPAHLAPLAEVLADHGL